MSWHSCLICEGGEIIDSSEISKNPTSKLVNYHEPSSIRQFHIKIDPLCSENAESGLEPAESKKPVSFYVDLAELIAVCPYFERFEGQNYLEISTNCTSTWISAPPEVVEKTGECRHDYTSPLSARHFHAFLESACPSLYGIRPVPITMSSIVPVLDMLSHFHSEPLLTNCERLLMSTNITQLDGILLIRLLDKGLCVSLDHRILGRILCVCLMNIQKLTDVSHELIGSIGAVFAQAFVANATKNFRHIKPLEQEPPLLPLAVRHLMVHPADPTSSASSSSDRQKSPEDAPISKKSRKNGKRKTAGCDHSEDSFECILCFDKRCGKCKGEAAFCYKALDNFLYEVRLQLYPHTYRSHMDRDMLREDRFNDYILRHQLQPLP
uniref:Uncharacterized protein n=1 Tax=Caenorhabditis japonica TaxID=281687 RepID=A0A8R1HQ13_CAEJA